MTQVRNVAAALYDATAQAESSGYRIIWCSNALGIAEAGPVCVVLWRRNVTPERFRRQELALAEVVHRHPGRAGLLCVVETGTAAPDERLRAASIDMVKSHGARLCGTAAVVQGSGFRAAVSRSALSGMALLLANHTVKISGSITTASSWLGARCNVEPSPLIAACHAMHEQLASELSLHG